MTKENPNPFIASNTTETLNRVSAGLVLLQDIEILRSIAADADKEGEANLSTSGSHGHYLFVESLRFAIEREAKLATPVREVANV